MAERTGQIEGEALRVGMFIHLDVGWMGHPFPLSSFRIGSIAQIEIIRTLGLKRVRWSPEHSEPDTPSVTLSLTARPLAPLAPAETAEAAARRERREALASQRAALNLCERQFGEATRECRQLT